ncbi:hypothetical protein WKW80_34810 [Variovorax humicola]|uniref:Uncharacterized protein n=1 Tax=Variovorax humicola TaxID=1769758 RepID=A0ABU8WCA4_9BURK
MPKGRPDGRSLAAIALVEVFEEAGLCIRLLAFLCDVTRKETFSRFYLGTHRRLAGRRDVESQAVALAPLADLRAMLTHPGDQVVLDAYEAAIKNRGQRRRLRRT